MGSSTNGVPDSRMGCNRDIDDIYETQIVSFRTAKNIKKRAPKPLLIFHQIRPGAGGGCWGWRGTSLPNKVRFAKFDH